MTHTKTLLGALALGLSSLASGCVGIASSMPGIQNATGEAWFTETTGIGFLAFSTRVYYCPPPAGSAPAQCMQAQMIEPASSPSERPRKAAAAKEAPPAKAPAAPAEQDDR